ncbi:MAG TPA: DUF4347 domain-containing protein [Thermosynechococcaceae cyanobacterium]
MPFEPPQLATPLTDALFVGNTASVLDQTSLTTALPGLRQSSQSLLFVDESVVNYKQLVAGVAAGIEVHVLNPVQDAVTQITNVLLGREGISSLHIVSHGEAGGLDFSGSCLNFRDLPGYTVPLQSWSKALTEEADILLYGCSVAATAQGVDFVQQLSHLTGADVAASIDLTGSANRGGDWDLEVATGKIESALPFHSEELENYGGVFDRGIVKGQYVQPTGTGSGEATLTGQQQYTLTVSGTFSKRAIAKAAAGQSIPQPGSPSQSPTPGVANPISEQFLIPHPPRVNFIHVKPVPSLPQPQPPTPGPIAPGNRGSIALAQTLITVGEAGGSAAVSVLRSGGSDGVATVDYTTVNATAVAGQDYTGISGTLTFASGETSKTVIIPIADDAIIEGTETFNFAMDATTGAALGVARTATLTVLDDDAAPTIDFAQPNFNVNEDNGTATVTLRRSGNTSSPSSVQVTTSDGTALANSDYTAASGTVTFAIGETVKTFAVAILNDITGERNETINLTLSNAVGAGLATQTTTLLTIADDDPGNFVQESFVSGLNQPTSFGWSPDGSRMYIAQKGGEVKVAVNGVVSGAPFINLSDQVNNAGDRGLLGIAIHPDFVNNPYIYLSFTYDPPEAASGSGLAGRDQLGNRPSRLIRVTADAATNYTTAIAGSAVVLLGTNSVWANISNPDKDSTEEIDLPPSGILNYGTPQQTNIQDYLATDNQVHTIGFLKFGLDGSLFVSNADGASYGRVDPRAARTLDIDNLSGKILRIDPITGRGLADNPFYNGDPTSNRSKVYNYGLRNPFRFTINPTTGEPVIGDVGWNTWEEINTGRGKNFGWPYYEGGGGANLPTGGYADLPEAQVYYSSGQQITPSVYSRAHSDGARAIIMGDFYTGTTFPSIYDGALFVTDVEEGNVDALYFDQNGQLTSTRRFDTGVPYTVQITTGIDSNLYYANLAFGEIGRWRPV